LKATWTKFTTSEKSDPLRGFLASTGDRELVEASKDNIWGCGLTLAEARKFKGAQWPGQNLLGKALMEVRKELFDKRGE
jgi:ribA/ribD-fused uncharacterized protein